MNLILKEKLKEIWQNIHQEYKKGEICTERHLRAELFHQLKMNLGDDYNIWVEPTLEANKENIKVKIIPDLLISKNDRLVAVIELKYKPSREVHFKKDIEKFQHFNAKYLKIAIETDPNTGNWIKEKELKINDEILFVFAVVANSKAWALKYEKVNENNHLKNFLHLTGKIDNNSEINFLASN